jgi:3-phytase
MGLIVSLFVGVFALATPKSVVYPIFETDPVSSPEDAADDTALWVHPSEPRKSLIVATDKKAGLIFYSLEGRRLGEFPVGLINNVDSRDNIPYGKSQITLLAGSDRTSNAIALFTVDPTEAHSPKLVSLGHIQLPYIPYGICLGAVNSAGETAVFVTTKEGFVHRWLLRTQGKKVTGRYDGAWQLSGKTEGCVVDETSEQLFVAEEAVGLWRFDLKSHKKKPVLVDSVKPAGSLAADVEGVAIYRGPNSNSYIVVSSQGDNSFHVYDLYGLRSRGAFKIDGANGIDEVTHTDGIEILGPGRIDFFPDGLFIAQDDVNDDEHQALNQNFKAVDWKQIRSALLLP